MDRVELVEEMLPSWLELLRILLLTLEGGLRLSLLAGLEYSRLMDTSRPVLGVTTVFFGVLFTEGGLGAV